ncbi:hypothetical protein [Mesoplasma melaleucae]|uniref:Uncharacterized protein n=1 Tax=Mesoplasma melaleucae TaxID=81459 RepID=A0A2K8NWF2_9MOLU|nr:hypothetical protein [Mesoplasma melaleucae]ATZ18149.1 hypothetical protein EMELA_v1c06420 [Mesoplasma melaleucae]
MTSEPAKTEGSVTLTITKFDDNSNSGSGEGSETQVTAFHSTYQTNTLTN